MHEWHWTAMTYIADGELKGVELLSSASGGVMYVMHTVVDGSDGMSGDVTPYTCKHADNGFRVRGKGR